MTCDGKAYSVKSQDKLYCLSSIVSLMLNADDANPAVKADYSDFEIMVILSKVTKSATGCDDIPYDIGCHC